MPLAHYAWYQLQNHEKLARYAAYAVLITWVRDAFFIYEYLPVAIVLDSVSYFLARFAMV